MGYPSPKVWRRLEREPSSCERICVRLNGEKYDADSVQLGIFEPELKNPFYFSRYIFRADELADCIVSKEQEQYFEDAILLKYMKSGRTTFYPDTFKHGTADERLESKHAKYYRAFEKAWYTDYINNLVIPVLTAAPTYEQQCMALYLICHKYYVNRTVFNKRILNIT